jgi:hypothetical protein
LPDRLSAHGVDFVLLHLPGKVDASAADHCSSTPAQAVQRLSRMRLLVAAKSKISVARIGSLRTPIRRDAKIASRSRPKSQLGRSTCAPTARPECRRIGQ